MELKTINLSLTVSAQISVDDITVLKEAGIESIICNRPNHEDPGQPDYIDIEKAAQKYGMQCRFMPVISGHVSVEKGLEFGQLIKELPKPIHAYCRSGTRCTILWALSELQTGADRDTVIKQAASAGYDVSRVIKDYIEFSVR